MSAPRTSPKLAYMALATAGALWGTSFMFGKFALAEMGPAYLVLYRFVLASVVLLPFVSRARPRIESRDLGLLVVGAVLMGPFMFLLQFEGLDRTTASSAALLVGTVPPMIAIGGFLVDKERPNFWIWVAIGVSALGLILLIGGPGIGRTLTGDLLVFISLIASVVWTLLIRRVGRRVGVLTATTFLFSLGTLILLPFAIVLEGSPPLVLSLGAWVSVGILGVVCTALTFWLWNWGFQRAEAARAGLFVNFEPLIGSILGVTILDEHLGPFALVGGALVISAALMVSVSKTEVARV